MYELTVALRYLVPKRKTLSTALISFLSIIVISLVVWLVLVFLSVTTGIERNWLQKLTSLHSPLRITPTETYYKSYYYQSDSLSAGSNYTLKTIGEKAISRESDPYSDQSDAQIPLFWPSPERHPNGQLRDPVKETLTILRDLNLNFQDYEIGGALLRLTLSHPTKTSTAGATLSQMSYLLSFMDHNPNLASLLLPPSVEDLDSMLKMSSADPNYLESIFSNSKIEEVSINHLDTSFFPEGLEFIAYAHPQKLNEILLPVDKNSSKIPEGWQKGALRRKGSQIQWKGETGTPHNLSRIQTTQALPLKVLSITSAPELNNVLLSVKAEIQGHSIEQRISWNAVTLSRATAQMKFDQIPRLTPPWAIEIAGRAYLPRLGSNQAFLIPKTYRDMGIRIGDRGTLNFASVGAASAQEQRLSVQVAGFYDPGLFSMGGRCIIVPQSITRTIHAASQTFSPDGTPTNGISVWTKLEDIESAKQKMEEALNHAHLLPYWKISTYQDYEFSKELFQQFRSDRTLFLMIALLILLVACCNIISLLVLLVNDKKREIAILQAMGASKRSIASIFGCCGLCMGSISSLIGTLAAIFTLKHLDCVVHFLSTLQGHAAFQPAFFGQTLPNQLSHEALLFVLITTPLLALIAGLIPALRACRIRPSIALRQE